MNKNVGNTDKLVRLVLALVIAILFFTNVITGVVATVLGIIALVLVITSLLNFCGLYAIFGCSTCKTKPADNK